MAFFDSSRTAFESMASSLRGVGWPRLRRAVGMCSLALLGACGGGGGDAPQREQILGGQVWPERADLVFVEYDERGAELQRSTATDALGRFVFARPLSGARLEATAFTPSFQVERAWSARVPRNGPLVVTPVTTLRDQFGRTGMPDDAAAAWVKSEFATACGADAQAAIAAAAEGVHPGEAAAPLAVAGTADGFMRILARLGTSPAYRLDLWDVLARTHLRAMGPLCAVQKDVWSAGWVDRAWSQARSRWPSADSAWLRTALQQGRQRALDAVADALTEVVAYEEFPSLRGVLADERVRLLNQLPSIAMEAALAALAEELADSAAATSAGARDRALAADGARQVVSLVKVAGGGSALVGMQRLSLPKPEADVPLMTVENRGTASRELELVVNRHDLNSHRGVLSSVLGMPVGLEDRLLHRRAWRYLVSLRRHQQPITAGRMLHHPEYLLRTVGAGYCDDMASALHYLWKSLGLESRVVALTGHVVAEVLIDGRWEMYDADFGAYVRGADQRVASVDTIAANTDLLRAPTYAPQWLVTPEVFHDALHSIYSSTADNFPDSWHSQWLGTLPNAAWRLPPGAKVDFYPTSTVLWSQGVSEPVTAARFVLSLPAGFSGEVTLPFVATSIEGSGTVQWKNEAVELDGQPGSALPNRYLWEESYDLPPDRLTVLRTGAAGIRIVFAVNPLLMRDFYMVTLDVVGANLSGVRLMAARSN